MDVIITHEFADLDALASLIAASLLYEDAVCLRNGQVSTLTRRYLALHKDALPLKTVDDVDPEQVDRVIAVDTRKASRLREFSDYLEAADEVCVWDHHPASGDDIPADELHIEPVGACVTLLTEALRQKGAEPTEEQATLMLLGLYADTGSLTFDQTTARDVEAGAFMLRAGAQLPVVNRYLRDQFSRDQRRLLADLMSDDEELDLGTARIVVASAEASGYVDGAANVVEHMMEMLGHEAMFALIGFNGGSRIQIVARSRVPYVHVGEICEAFGGGGHPGAAGASRKESTLEEVKEELREVLESSDLEPTRVRDLMTSPVHTVERDLSLGECRDKFDHWEISGAPVVVTCGEVEGVISRRDIEGAARADDLDLPVAARMSHEVCSIDAEASLEAALRMMTEHDIGRLPVMEEGRLIGIVSRTDVRAKLYDA